MPHYMLQFTYTPQAWDALSERPTNRFEAVQALLAKLGGRLHTAYYAFGEYDGVLIVELPDNVTTAAASMAINAAGHLKAIKTTMLLPVEEAIDAMRVAGGLTYRPPVTADDRDAAAMDDRTRADATAHTDRHAGADAVTAGSMDSMAASDACSWSSERS